MEGRKIYGILMVNSEVRHIDFQSNWLFEDGERLDGAYYINEGRKTRKIIDNMHLDKAPLKTLVERIFKGDRFSRVYIFDPRKGKPFLSSSDIIKYDVSGAKIISSLNTKNLQDLIIKKSWILVSRSGTIGNVSFVNNQLDGVTCSEHVMRIVPNIDFKYSGYLYAFLSSKAGYNLLKSGTYGSVVNHIEPEHMYDIPVLLLGKNKQKEIHENILKVFEWRELANKYVKDSLGILNDTLKIGEAGIKDYLNMDNVDFWESEGFDKWLRFDANYYNTGAESTISLIKSYKNKNWIKRLTDVTKKIVNPPRSSRIYVEKDKGVPYYSGTDLSQFCKNDLKYLAKVDEQLVDVTVKENWTLITRVGTTGIAYFVDALKDGQCVSDNVLRLIPNDEILPEYLFLFLKSPYGKIQLDKIKTGSVQDYIPEEYMKDILLIVPDKKIQEKIVEKTKLAINLRNKADILEEKCKSIFDKLVFGS